MVIDDVATVPKKSTEFLSREGANTNEDLEELWTRIVFSICVTNTDDHLRNHGFILTDKGWRLSPAYDINPVPTGNGLMLNISENDNSLDIALALSVRKYFRLSSSMANKIVDRVVNAVDKWRIVAKKLGISPNEMEVMARAFLREK